MQVVYELERNYIGYDIAFMDFNRKVKDIITGKSGQGLIFAPQNTITLYEHTSEHMEEIKDNSMDLCFTSPAYWDLEYYNDHPDQLGYNKTYEEFLAGIKRVLSECFRVLKPEKYCVWNINDFRKNGKYYMYHADIAKIIQEVGFKLFDIIIIPWKSAIGAAFADQVWSRKVTAKKHEYLIIAKKEK